MRRLSSPHRPCPRAGREGGESEASAPRLLFFTLLYHARARFGIPLLLVLCLGLDWCGNLDDGL